MEHINGGIPNNTNYLLEKHSGFYAVLSAGMLLALCAIWHGDLNMWRKAKIHISEANAKDDREREIIELASKITGRQVIANLSEQNRAIARLAAFKLSDAEIAERMHMSLSGVKQAIRIIKQKSGLERDAFAAIL